MKLLIGFLLGLGTAWAALAIWQRVPQFPEIDDSDRGERAERVNYPPVPKFDPNVHLPRRPDTRYTDTYPPYSE